MNNFIFTNFNNQYIDQFKTDFQSNFKVTIPTIFTPTFAELVVKYASMEKNWVLAAGIDKVRYENPINTVNQKKNDAIGVEVNKGFSQNRFSYIFHRTMNNKNPSILEKDIRKALSSAEFLNFLSEITGLNLTKLTTMFMSKYRSGHFLSPHSDTGNGRIAFVISLSKDWLPQYGGLLNFLSDDRNQVIETYCPMFNHMVIFQVDENHKHPHYVSHVAPNVSHNRISIVGWFE
jgi:SM-20-related protein